MTQQRMIIGSFAALLTLSFFLPWIHLDLGFFAQSFSGAALPGQLRSLMAAGDAINSAFGGQATGASSVALLFYVLFLIPVLSGLLAWRAFSGRGGRLSLRALAAVTGLTGLLLAGLLGALLSSLIGSELSELLTGGGYLLTLLTAGGLVVAAAFLKNSNRVALTPEQQAAVQARGQQALAGTGQWLGQQATRAERRVRRAVGLTAGRTVLGAQDRVIAARGTVITDALIEQARAAGVLSALLDSAETGQGDQGASLSTAPVSSQEIP
jgi:hypothetical protein